MSSTDNEIEKRETWAYFTVPLRYILWGNSSVKDHSGGNKLEGGIQDLEGTPPTRKVQQDKSLKAKRLYWNVLSP